MDPIRLQPDVRARCTDRVKNAINVSRVSPHVCLQNERKISPL